MGSRAVDGIAVTGKPSITLAGWRVLQPGILLVILTMHGRICFFIEPSCVTIRRHVPFLMIVEQNERLLQALRSVLP
jgi:hypothetical protein